MIKTSQRNPMLWAMIAVLPVFLFSWYLTQFTSSIEIEETDPTVLRNRSKVIGGVNRPLSDFALNKVGSSQFHPLNSSKGRDYNSEFGVITCPKVPRLVLGENPQMDSVIEACDTGEHFERVSPYILAQPFDLATWNVNNSSYLNIAAPSRVFDVAQPSEDVPPLKNISMVYSEIKEGESLRLEVQTAPNMPATFTLFGTGKFDNGISTITVAADDKGKATAVYIGTSVHTSEILCGSPVASGTIRFRVRTISSL